MNKKVLIFILLICSGFNNAIGSIEGIWGDHDTIWVFASDGTYTCYLNGNLVSTKGFYVEEKDTIHITYKYKDSPNWQEEKVHFAQNKDTLFIHGYIFIQQNNTYCKNE